jgi:hypothetical protein
MPPSAAVIYKSLLATLAKLPSYPFREYFKRRVQRLYAPSRAGTLNAGNVNGDPSQNTDSRTILARSDDDSTKKTLAGKRISYNWSPETTRQAQEDLEQLKRILKVQKLYASGIPLIVEQTNEAREAEAH